MGSMQSKLKEAYSVKQKPLFKRSCQKGVNPTLRNQIQTTAWPTISRNQSHQITTDSHNLRIISEWKAQNFQNKNEVIDETIYPLCSIGLIQFQIDHQIKYGAGCLIGKGIVLTCAHNIYSPKRGKQSRNIKFFPNFHSQGEKYYPAKRIYYPNEFHSNIHNDDYYQKKLFQYDYGIIQLEDDGHLEKQCGRLGFNFSFDEHTQQQQKLFVGYARLKNEKKRNILKYKFSGNIKIQTYSSNSEMQIDLDMAGGPIIDEVEGEYLIIGIHTFIQKSHQKIEVGGLRLNEIMFSQICNWITQQELQINLRDQNIGKQGIKQLVKSNLHDPHVIYLCRNDIGKDGLKYLPRRQWNQLYHLDLGGNHIGAEGVEYLIKSNLKNLVILNIWGNEIGKEGAGHMVNSDWKFLNCLNIYNNNICNQGLEYLIQVTWPELNSINLGKNNIDNQGVTLLLKASWRALVTLNLWGNSIKDDKTNNTELTKHFPRMRFLSL